MLVSDRSPFEILNWQRDSSGRIISVLFKLDELRFNLVNIYAPTNPAQRKGFYDTLHEFFYPNSFKIIAGDFNCYESSFDKFGGNSSPSTDLRNFRLLHGFIDAWRAKHGRQLFCTWFNSDKTIGSRLDKFFVAHDLLLDNFSCEISPCVFSDHDSVHLSLDLAKVTRQGPGIWRFNVSLLDDADFLAHTSALIKTHVLYQETFPSLHDWWDFLKESIKNLAINFSKDKHRQLNHDKIIAVNHLTQVKRSLLNGLVSPVSARKTIGDLESKIQSIHLTQQKSCQIQSRAR